MSSPRVSMVPVAPPFTPLMLPSSATSSPSHTNRSHGSTPPAFALNTPFTPSRTSVSPSLAFRGFTSPYPSLAAPSQYSSHSLLDTADAGTLAPPNIDAIAGARVHALASNYMLLEYAAQLKGLTEHGIIRTGRTLRHIPREIGEAVRYVRKEAARIILAIQTEIQDIASGKRAERANLERIKNAHNHLQAATELLNSAEVQTVAMAKKRRQSAHMRPPPAVAATDVTIVAVDAPLQITQQSEEEKKLAVNSLAFVMANLSATAALPPPFPSPSASLTPSSSSSSTSTESSSNSSNNTTEAEVAAAKHLTALQEQIQLLKQQMETMAKLQQLMPQAAAAVASGTVSAGVASVGPAIPLAPTLHSRNNSVAAAPFQQQQQQQRSVASVPQAPVLLPTSFFFTGMESVQEEENAPVVSSDASVPLAPPPPCAFTAPSTSAPAAPATPSSSSSSSTAAAPSQPTTTPFARAGILGEITNRAQLRSTAAAPGTPAAAAALASPTKRPATTPRSASVIVPSSADKKNLSVNVYTRRIPGSESMSLQDSIKVASRIKLRKTDQERSPGGTPCKDKRKAYTTNSTQDVLQAALAARFKNIHALDAAKVRSQSLCLPRTPAGVTSLVEDGISNKPRNTPSHARRDSVDKENWETS